MRLRFYTLGGITLAHGATEGQATACDLFDAMRRGELFVEPVAEQSATQAGKTPTAEQPPAGGRRNGVPAPAGK